jgi:hypothetical protein
LHVGIFAPHAILKLLSVDIKRVDYGIHETPGNPQQGMRAASGVENGSYTPYSRALKSQG